MSGTPAEIGRPARGKTDGRTARRCLAAMRRKRGLSNRAVAEGVCESCKVAKARLADARKGGAAAIPRRKGSCQPRNAPPEARRKIAVAAHRGRSMPAAAKAAGR